MQIKLVSLTDDTRELGEKWGFESEKTLYIRSLYHKTFLRNIIMALLINIKFCFQNCFYEVRNRFIICWANEWLFGLSRRYTRSVLENPILIQISSIMMSSVTLMQTEKEFSWVNNVFLAEFLSRWLIHLFQ